MSVGEIFADAQKSAINHKSLAKRLRKIEAKHANNPSRFEEQVKECVYRCLDVAKSERAGVNIVKFVCAYCASTQSTEDDEEGSTITSEILLGVLPHMSAKDKTVRYRATQIVSQLMLVVTEMDDDLYQAIRHELIKRLRDRVPAIRMEAVSALGPLMENEMDQEAEAAQAKDSEDDDTMMSDEFESSGLLDKLLDVLQNDTNADVRKALLLNLPVEPKTLPYLLERARDRDAPTRRALYAKLMKKLGDFRHLSLSMREKLLRWGLRDRDEKVRNAASKMFSHLWIEQISKTIHQAEAEQQGKEPDKVLGLYEPSMSALLELLERIDIINSGQDDGVGLEAMKHFWSARPDYFDAVSFEDDFWNDLSVESAFMARTFYDYCQNHADAQARAEDKMPEVTKFGFYLQKHLQKILYGREEMEEEDVAEQEFILEQLLHIAHTLDYTDEIGRRKMFSLLRQVLSNAELPEVATKLTVEALRLTCNADSAGEKEFIAVVMEAVAEVHDVIASSDQEGDDENIPGEEESFVSARSEVSSESTHTEKASGRATNKSNKQSSKQQQELTPEEAEAKQFRELLINLKCLSIVHTMLQNIACEITSNISLETMLNTLVIPAVRSQEAPVRESALECLGLCCLLSPRLATENWDTFVYCIRKGHDELKSLCLKVLCDILLMQHKTSASGANGAQSETESIDLSPFVKAFEYSSEVQTIATTSIGKLMLCGFYKDESNVEVFDAAIEEAEKSGTKGWDLLAKIKVAVKSDEPVVAETADVQTIS